MTAVSIRQRTAADLPECVRLLAETHRLDGYPAHWPDAPRAWLDLNGLIGVWVAADDERILGHIALRFGAFDSSARVRSAATDRPIEQLASVTRFFVSSCSRRRGVGHDLLDVVCNEAAARGLHPSLDVVGTNHAAIRLYERLGWKRVLSEVWSEDPSGTKLLHHYVAPQ